MRLAPLAACLGIGLLVAVPVAPARAPARAPEQVSIEFAAYGPSQLDVLPGETVLWSNVSQRTHTVTSDTGLFDSGHVGTGGRFAFRFTTPGTYRYHCTIHSNITGEIDVRELTLGVLPTAAVPVGQAVEFDGRTATPSRSVRIEERASGSGFATVATAKPAPDGTWKVNVRAGQTGEFRAVSGNAVSESRRMIVGIRRVHVAPTRTGIDVSVSPSDPYAKLLVEVYLRERFGWWPVRRATLDYVSEAVIPVRRPARVRVVLVDTDGWTPIATSKPVTLR
jgi:plastocyanin